MPAVLFVCLGNICRSPMAEAVLRHMVRSRPDADDWSIDSAGTGPWHVGEAPDRRTVNVLKRHGIDIVHRGRQIEADDGDRFDHILAMDEENLTGCRLVLDGGRAELGLLGDYDPEGVRIVGDPYYGGGDGFETVYRQVDRACRAFLEQRYPLPT